MSPAALAPNSFLEKDQQDRLLTGLGSQFGVCRTTAIRRAIASRRP